MDENAQQNALGKASDEELLASWLAGGESAGSALCKRYVDPLYRFFRRKTDSPEDLAQQTLTAVVEGRKRFEGRSSFRAFVFGVARNMLLANLRRRSRSPGPPDFNAESIEDLAPSPSAVVADRSEQQQLLEALPRIPVELQLALELYYWEGLSGPELAVVLGISEGGARSRLRRAKTALREALKALGCSSESADASVDSLTPPDEPL